MELSTDTYLTEDEFKTGMLRVPYNELKDEWRRATFEECEEQWNYYLQWREMMAVDAGDDTSERFNQWVDTWWNGKEIIQDPKWQIKH